LAWLVLLLKHASMNIIRILEPSGRGPQPLILWSLKGRHFVAVEFLGVHNIGVAGITVEAHFHKYNTYFRTIVQRPAAPDPRVLEGRHFFTVGFLGAGTIGMADITAETNFQEYNTYFRTTIQRPAAPNPKGT
jgi:hypothetical protein